MKRLLPAEAMLCGCSDKAGDLPEYAPEDTDLIVYVNGQNIKLLLNFI